MKTGLQERTFERSGCRLHYWISPHEREPGNSPTARPWLVFLHGAGANHTMFHSQLPVLTGRYPLLLWDAPGHGKSQPLAGGFDLRRASEDLLALLDQEGIHQAIFIGQSLGGNLAQELVFQHPERALALVMIDCTCNTLAITPAEKLALAITPGVLRLSPWEGLKRQMASAVSVRPEVREEVYQMFSQVTKATFTAALMAGAAVLRPEPGYKIEQPMLLVVGEFDITGNIRKVAPRWAAREPHCRYEVIPSAGHCSNQDNPETFNRILLEFLEGLAPTGAGLP